MPSGPYYNDFAPGSDSKWNETELVHILSVTFAESTNLGNTKMVVQLHDFTCCIMLFDDEVFKTYLNCLRKITQKDLL